MSDQVKASFNVFYDENFKTLGNGVTIYVEGKRGNFVSMAESLYDSLAELGLSPKGHRFWYKLPLESLKELKLLYNEGVNFSRLCEEAKGGRIIDILCEKDEDSDKEDGEDAEEEAAAEDPKVEENGEDAEEEATAEDPNVEEEANADDNVVSRGDVEEEAEASGSSDKVCEEEARVENIVADVVDDSDAEDNGVYPSTPVASDSEEEEETIRYERWRRGTGVLAIRQVFESVEEFREVVLEYALKGGWNVQYTRWGGVKSEARCGVVSENPCPWRIYCSYEKAVNQWMVKTFQEDHTCNKDGRCKILSEGIIAKLIIDDLRNDPKMMPKAIQSKFEKRYNLTSLGHQRRLKQTKCKNGGVPYKPRPPKKAKTQLPETMNVDDYGVGASQSQPTQSTQASDVE